MSLKIEPDRRRDGQLRGPETGDGKMNIQGWEWIIILVIVLLVFGIGRIGKLGEELGKGVREFRKGVREGNQEEEAEEGKQEESQK